ncbi:MAG: 2-hydroxyacyl-CoA dehydratase [Desulfobacteraceae bacterium]|nr:2-hydroxyacyl-CoA dehydratase [Desulfobacteraceae bacterium]
MNDKKVKGLSKVENYYQHYGLRAGELNKEGEKVIGYICSFVPVEIITAAGCIPFRIKGDVHEPITKGDNLMETIVCPLVRSYFDLCLKGRYDFLSGIVIPHACDSMVRGYSAWNYSLDLPYSYFLNIPSVVKESSFEFFNAELNNYRRGLERFVGKEISDDDIAGAIRLHNNNREKAKALYEFTKPEVPLISGTELRKVLAVGLSLPISESNQLFDEVLTEIKERKASPGKKGPRILIDGACIDNYSIMEIVEGLEADVVTDTVCTGTRDYWPEADTGIDPIDALAIRYLDKINCPKTYRENRPGTFEGDIADRFGDIGARAEEFNVDGAILLVYKFCDPFGFEVPARKAYYESVGIPLLCLESEYSAGTIGQLKTRIQAFLEMIG